MKLNQVRFGSTNIFRPSPNTELWLRRQARSHLFERFCAGEYAQKAAANEVIKHQFGFYAKLLDRVMPTLCERGAADFLLDQYDRASKLLHGHGILDLDEREQCRWIQPMFKRGIKFILEQICIGSGQARPDPSQADSFFAMNVGVACAEMMVHLAQESDLIHSIFPTDCMLRVFDSGPLDYTIRIEGDHASYDERFEKRVIRDRNSRDEVVHRPPFDVHTETHQRYLDDAFSDSFGMTYGHFIEVLRQSIKGSCPSLHPNDFPTLFVHRGRLIDELVKASGQPRSAIELALDGFTVTPANMRQEGRQVIKPKQVRRALRRGFFLMPHKDGPHLSFSRSMAMENMTHLVGAVCYQRLPPEWKEPTTCKALIELSAAAGKWFEGQVATNLQKLGVIGAGASRRVGSVSNRLNIPNDVGQIDFIGVDTTSKLIIVLEAKMVQGSLEPASWRDEIDDFVRRDNSYIVRFRRKLEWVSRNRQAIGNALGCPFEPGVGGAMVTLYPSIAQEFIDDVPCVSLTELVLDYQRARAWPYAVI